MSQENIIVTSFYLFEYSDAAPGCATYLGGELNHDETEWNIFERRPFEMKVEKKYVLQITDKSIKNVNFDMEGG